MITCKLPGCKNTEHDTEKGFKNHLTKEHGGYTQQTLKDHGITPSARDIARSLAGNESAADVTQQAPENEPKPGDQAAQKRTRQRKEIVDPAVEKAKQDILRARCRRIASLPYSLLSSLLKDERLKLDFDEEQMLTESYLTLAMAYGWEGTSKLLLWGDVLIVNSVVFMRRKDYLTHDLGLDTPTPPPAEEAAQSEKEPIVQ